MNKYNIKDIELDIKEAIDSSKSMREAASKVNMNCKTFFKYSKELGLFKPNPSGKGISKPIIRTILADILDGKYPQYHTYKLGKRLIKEGLKLHKCENCNLTEWLDRPIPLELHHIDGNSYNHKYENLQLLCPNCHSQTDNFKSKNKYRRGESNSQS